MWVKVIGGSILLLSALIDCYQYERRSMHVKRRLGAWVALLTDIRTHIACFGAPLSDTLLHADPAVLSVLDIRDAGGGAQVLLERCREDADFLPAACGELLLRLSEELGTVWRQEQVQRLDYYVETLEKQRVAYCESVGSEVRIRRVLSLLGTVGTILLVW
jgi:hypothetical protein